MVVTCENCAARYKLDDSRISGRGAKITCPRCRHVFVVYREQAAGQVAVGGGVASPAAPPSPEPAPAAAPAQPAAAASIDVDSLDFRRVGIQAWKVKVKIGLVYDFSDYRTLARYIAEGRVTPADKLSHNGQDWTEISQISDLAGHFVSVYQALEAEQAAAAAAEEDDADDYEDDEPTNIIGMGSFPDAAPAKPVSLTSFSSSASPRILPSGGDDDALSAAMGAALEQEEAPAAEAPRPTGPSFIDPFEKKRQQSQSAARRPRPSTGPMRKPAARPKPSKSDASSGGSGGRLGLVALVVLAVGGGIWWFTQGDAGAPSAGTSAPPAPAALASGEGDQKADNIREQIENEMMATEPEPVEDPVDDEPAFGVDDEPVLIPVGPRGPTAGSRPAPRSTPPPSAGKSAAGHASDGDSSARRGDWGKAASSYRKAVSMEPRNSVYNGKLGTALNRSGDASGAMSPLMTAASGGYAPAFRELGDIAAARGDKAGAIGHYQSYLATNPPDAGKVQAKIDRLSGS